MHVSVLVGLSGDDASPHHWAVSSKMPRYVTLSFCCSLLSPMIAVVYLKNYVHSDFMFGPFI
jgi:hypothetical protein